MKKYLIGAVAGFLLSLSVTAYADDISSAVGKVVGGETTVKVDGTQLSKKALIVDGTAYLPVRAIADAVKYDVKYDPKAGVEMNSRQIVERPVQTTPSTGRTVLEIQSEIERVKEGITGLEQSIQANPNNPHNETNKSNLQMLKDKLVELEDELTKAQAAETK